MEAMLQGLVIIGGLTFSLAASLLIEELIFGRIVRLAFVRQSSKFPSPTSQFAATATTTNRKKAESKKLRTEN